MKRFSHYLLCALFFISCSSQKFLPSAQKTETTPLKLWAEVETLAKKVSPDAALVGVLSSDTWPDGLVIWTNDEIDKSYVAPTGTAPRWDFYFAKSTKSILPKPGRDDLFIVNQADLFGFRYIAASSNDGKGGYIKLEPKQFATEFNIPSNQAISMPKLDADQALKIAQQNIAERFISLKMGNPLKPERLAIAQVAHALQQDPVIGPLWEFAAVFEDSFGGKKGALLYVNGTDGSIPPWEMNPFDIKVEMKRETISRKQVRVYELRTRDFSKTKELLAEWITRAEEAKEYERLMQPAPAVAAP